MKPRLLLLAAAAALTCLAAVIHVLVRADVRRPPSLTALVGRNSLTGGTDGGVQYSVHRIEENVACDRVSLTTIRVRPVLPGRTAPAPHAASSACGK